MPIDPDLNKVLSEIYITLEQTREYQARQLRNINARLEDMQEPSFWMVYNVVYKVMIAQFLLGIIVFGIFFFISGILSGLGISIINGILNGFRITGR